MQREERSLLIISQFEFQTKLYQQLFAFSKSPDNHKTGEERLGFYYVTTTLYFLTILSKGQRATISTVHGVLISRRSRRRLVEHSRSWILLKLGGSAHHAKCYYAMTVTAGHVKRRFIV